MQKSPQLAPYYQQSSPSPSPTSTTGKIILRENLNIIDSDEAQDPNSQFPKVRTVAGLVCSCNINPDVTCNPGSLMIINVVTQCQQAEICTGECEYQIYCGKKIGNDYYIDYEIAAVDLPNRRFPADGSPSTGWASDCFSNV